MGELPFETMYSRTCRLIHACLHISSLSPVNSYEHMGIAEVDVLVEPVHQLGIGDYRRPEMGRRGRGADVWKSATSVLHQTIDTLWTKTISMRETTPLTLPSTANIGRRNVWLKVCVQEHATPPRADNKVKLMGVLGWSKAGVSRAQVLGGARCKVDIADESPTESGMVGGAWVRQVGECSTG